MTATDNLIKERVEVAQAIIDASLAAKYTDLSADPAHKATPLCSQYVDMKVGTDTFTIRISDHFAGKPAEKPAMDTFKMPVQDIIAAIKLIAANQDRFVDAYEETGDFEDALKAVAA